jgi:hypothetical protein
MSSHRPVRLSKAVPLAAIVFASLLASRAQSAPAAAPSEVAPLADPSRCSIHVPPICQPGRRPICLCESDISLNCSWICAS